MYIDFHTHAFADNIAEKAVLKVASCANIKNCTKATISDNLIMTEEWGIDYSVLLPIATKPTQQTTINNWAAENNHGRIISFGTVHPDAEDKLSELERIKSLGMKGIKLHPDYQDFFLYEERVQEIFKKCGELGLIVVIHMGYDCFSPNLHHALPYHLAEMSDEYPETIFVGAHLGGYQYWYDTMRYLCGKPNVYLDTSYLYNQIDPKILTMIIKKHGAEKILFASDLPWNNPIDDIELIKSLSISKDEKELIFWKNAAKLLGIKL